MAEKRSAHLKKILANDPSFTNVLAGILMLCFESLWIVMLYDSGRVVFGRNFGWDLQLISAVLIVILTAPFLLASLFLASSMTETARKIVAVCSVLIGLTAAAFCVGVWLEVGTRLQLSFAVSRLPFALFGFFVLIRIRMLQTRIVQE